jgi:benzoyl-CoA reductase/2-hydroxyglutaryl-CoA dehydratase subunit BcrC/BadD/HgdB
VAETGNIKGGPVGITTTVPVEVIIAAGRAPLDLNNLFIASPDAAERVARAELDGFPRTLCSWIKGIYATAVESEDLTDVVAVSEGDCSNTHVMAELLERRGKRVHYFAYPHDRDKAALEREVAKLAGAFGTDLEAVAGVKARLDRIRAKLERLDELSWRRNKLTGGENHRWLVASSDFNGDPDRYEHDLDAFLAEAEQRSSRPEAELRLGYAGIPPIYGDLYEVVESLGARIVFNEMQRQFSIPGYREGLIDSYLAYTYPYDVASRAADVRREVERREIAGLVHYVQGFCYRQVGDAILRAELDVPILTIEGDMPGPVDARNRMRLESFVEMLRSP